ncbi:MAG: carboxypeptidase regulatory-like domain-containing protein [Bryobacteraceae bacterium]
MRHILFCLLFLVGVTAASAQVGGSGSITGTVTDPSGAVVAGATVTATNVATAVQTTRQTTDAGFFVLSPLPAGEYKVTVQANGFQTLSQEHVVVDALATVGLNPKLQVGASTQSVTVEAAPPLLRTDDATLGASMENAIYDSLPLAMNGVARDPTQFVSLAAGVSSYTTQVAGPSYGSFNGGQQYQNEVYLGGLPMTSAGTQGDTRNLALGISVEAVDQFQVETNNAKAMYEGQGVENFVLKSGTDHFHGAAYEYFRNTDMDARGFFPSLRPVEHQNEFGASLGGPIKKDKIFFFGNYNGYRFVSTSVPALQSIPTAQEQTGNFSALPAAIYDPATTACNASGVCTRAPFAGNIIPSSRISKVSQSLASYMPTPTNSNIQNNYLTELPETVSINNTTNTVDVNLSDKNRFSAMYSTGKYTTNFTGSLASGTDSLPLPYTDGRFVVEYPTTSQLHDTYVISPNLLNQVSVSFARIYIPLQDDTAAGDYPQKAGLTGLPPGLASTALPTLTFAGTNAPIGWRGSTATPTIEAVNTEVLQDNVQWTKGRHFLTFGFQFEALGDNYTNPATGTLASFAFSNNETATYSATGSISSNTGNSWASYLLGAVDSSAVTQNGVAETGGRYKDYAAYIQDDFKVSSKLTLNLGLRWNVWGPFHEVDNRLSFFNPLLPNPAAGGHLGALEFAGNGPDSCNCSIPIKTHYLNPGPRFGAAYRLDDKTVMRGGFALTYVHAGGVGGRVDGRQGLSQLGFDTSAAFSSPGSGAPAFYWDSGYPAYQAPPFINPSYGTGFITSNPTGAQTVNYADPQLGAKPPYYENWNLGIQRSLSGAMTLGVTYTASVGHFLPGAGYAGPMTNQIPLQYLSLGSTLTATANPTTIAAAQAAFPGVGLPFPNFVGTIGQMLRPYPQYGAIADPWANVGNSNYNALQVVFNRRLEHGLTFMLGYTFSKEIDDVSGSTSSSSADLSSRNPFNNALERAPGVIDHAQVFSATLVYKLPFGKGHMLGGGNAVVSHLVSNWQVSGIFTYTSGSPLTITANGCTSGGILGTCYPNYNPSFSGPVRINGDYGSGSVLGSTPTVYLAKSAFVDPPPFTVGNVPRSAAYGLLAPHLANEDVSLRREFLIHEKVTFALQADAFNITNAVYFTAPGANIDSASFGTLTSQNNLPRKIQLSGRITF